MFKIDTHMHTIASGHAYSTWKEIMDWSSSIGMTHICVTDHGPKMPGAAHPFTIGNQAILPDIWKGMKVIKGMEANIISVYGDTDYTDVANDKFNLGYVIASFHPCCIESQGQEFNTRAYINAMENSYVTTLGHIDDGRITCDYERVIEAAKKYGVLIEVNESSLRKDTFRLNAEENIKKYVGICKEMEVPIVLGSDSHFVTSIGEFSRSEEILKKIGMPTRLIVNSDSDLFEETLEGAAVIRKAGNKRKISAL